MPRNPSPSPAAGFPFEAETNSPAEALRTPRHYREGGSPVARKEARWCGTWRAFLCPPRGESAMDGIIYLVGLIVIVMAILTFFGLR